MNVIETWMIITWQMHFVVLLISWYWFVCSNEDGKLITWINVKFKGRMKHGWSNT
jgi:hypothetical protein